jgi:uncharacterized membrane protein YidH (DUF202 family)
LLGASMGGCLATVASLKHVGAEQSMWCAVYTFIGWVLCRVGQNRMYTPYMRIWPYIRWFSCQKYRTYTVYIWFWSTLVLCVMRVCECVCIVVVCACVCAFSPETCMTQNMSVIWVVSLLM